MNANESVKNSAVSILANISVPAGEAGTDVAVEVYRDFETCLKIRNEWDSFIEKLEGEIFLTYDWCRVWWNHYGNGRELNIFVFRKGREVVGILPMFKDTILLWPFRVRVMKIVGTDFTIAAVILPIKPEVMDEVAELFVRAIQARSDVDVVRLGPISGRYSAFDELVNACRIATKGAWQVKTRESDVQTYFRIATSWEEQLSGLSHEQRRTMRRKYERILREGRSVKCISASMDNFETLFDGFVEMHQSHWQRQGKPGHFVAWPRAYDFHKTVAAIQLERGRLRLYEVRLDDSVIGYNYGYKFGDTYYYLLFGRGEFEKENKTDFVRIDFGEMVKRAINEDIRWFDTMRGRYEYKLHLGGELFPIRNVYIRSTRLLSQAVVAGSRVLASGIDVGYSKIWRSRITPRLGIKPGSFWHIWLISHQAL